MGDEAVDAPKKQLGKSLPQKLQELRICSELSYRKVTKCLLPKRDKADDSKKRWANSDLLDSSSEEQIFRLIWGLRGSRLKFPSLTMNHHHFYFQIIIQYGQKMDAGQTVLTW